MKSIITIITVFLGNHRSRSNLKTLLRLLGVLFGLILLYSVMFHGLMLQEGEEHTWLTGLYWTLTVMTTLGFGDITFHTDVGRLFSILVLMTGVMFMLMILPFTFIEFFYEPWMKAQAMARTPRELPKETAGHVILTFHDPIAAALIPMLERYGHPYFILNPTSAEALELYEQGISVAVGELDDPDTYRRLRLNQAAMLVTHRTETLNTNITFTAREFAPDVPILAFAYSDPARDVLELAGASKVVRIDQTMALALSRRVIGTNCAAHVIGELNGLLIAEATVAGTELEGLTVASSGIRQRTGLSVIGVWDHGHLAVVEPGTPITRQTVLLLAGTAEQVDRYNSEFSRKDGGAAHVVIVGGGRVGRLTSAMLTEEGFDPVIIERVADRAAELNVAVVVGDATHLEVLKQARVREASSVIITSHDDDTNIALTIFFRRLRPQAQIIVRCSAERNVRTLHRAGADLVLSSASMGANTIFNELRDSDNLLLAEGVCLFPSPVPVSMAGRLVGECAVRTETGCTIIAVEHEGERVINPDIGYRLPEGGTLLMIGTLVAEERFLRQFKPELAPAPLRRRWLMEKPTARMHSILVWGICALMAGFSSTAAAADSVAVFSEIHYHPADGGSEWIELRNQLAVDLDIGGWALAGGVRYTFPVGTIFPAGGLLVIAESPSGVPGALGPWQGRLDNRGETVTLRDRDGRVMDRVSWASQSDWPVAANGFGFTLAKRGRHLASGEAASWQPSREVGGTPGAENFPTSGATRTVARVVAGADWRHWSGGGDPGAGWFGDGFDDSAWPSGAGVFQLGGDPLPAPWVAATALPAGPGLVYFRKSFEFGGDPASTVLRLRLLVDDGAVVYLNGTELARTNLAAEAGPGDAALSPRRAPPQWQEFDLAAGALRSGTNLLAVALHQAAVLPAYPTAVIDAGPVAVWRLGESQPSARDLADLPGPPEHGAQDGVISGIVEADRTDAGPQPTDFRNGVPFRGFEADNRAPRFRGNAGGGDDVVRVADDGRLDFSSRRKFTLSAWVRGPAAQEDGAGIIAKGLGGGGEQYVIDVVSNRYRFFARNAGGAARVAHSNVMPNNAWQHLAAVCDPDAGVFRLYVDGVSVVSVTPPSDLLATSHEVSIGARKNSNSSAYDLNFDGRIDEVSVFDRGLTAAEVATLHGAAFALSATGIDTTDAVFGLELDTVETITAPQLVISEIGGGGGGFAIELAAIGEGGGAVSGAVLSRIDGAGLRQDFALSALEIGAGVFPVIDAVTLGWPVAAGDRIVLLDGAGGLLDAVVVGVSPQVRAPDGTGGWLFRSGNSFGQANPPEPSLGVVIHEIMYHPAEVPGNSGQWIELSNSTPIDADLSGWRLDGGVTFTFPFGTRIDAGGHLVVAANPQALSGVGALGPWSGRLKRSSDRIILRNAAGNAVDRVDYHDEGRWPHQADGGGSSLELRDPRADRNAAENWAPSDEFHQSAWQTLSWSGVAAPAIANEPAQWKEFNLGLLDGPGEFLIDDVSVVDTASGQELIRNGSFNSGMAHWRALGTHGRSAVVPEPGNPGNSVLRVIATGSSEYQGNQIESTTAVSYTSDRHYTLSMRVRRISGGAKLNTRLYFNRLARTHTLAMPSRGGTPGLPNSRAEANVGPTYDGLRHDPAVPQPGEPVTVSVRAADPDGVTGMAVHYEVNGGAPQSAAMSGNGDGSFSAVIPGQGAASVVRFHVVGADGEGAVSMFPAAGPDSRALYVVDDGQAAGGSPHKFRLVMTAADAALLHAPNRVLGNERLGATVIADERDVYYDVGVRLKGSFVGRDVPRVGFHVAFPPERLFRGVHDRVAVDRSAHASIGTRELLAKHIINAAGGIPGMHDDLARFIHVLPGYNSVCHLRMAGFGDDYLASRFPNGDDGWMYEYEVLRSSNRTHDGTPEGIKLPDSPYVNLDLRDYGPDPETYRWMWLTSNRRGADHLAPAVAVSSMFESSGQVLAGAAAELLDVDQWLRAMACQSLLGVGDTIYTGSNIHNIRFYVRPHDGRMLYMPWDWDACFSNSTSAPLIGSGNVAKLVTATPHHRRSYLHHMHDLMATTYQTGYMSRWVQHYGAVSGENHSSVLTYINSRAAYVAGQFPADPGFSLAVGESDVSGFVTLTGSGGLAVSVIEVNGAIHQPVWTSNSAWRVSVPVPGGASVLLIRALDRSGAVVTGGTASVEVGNPNPPGWAAIRINEWMASNGTISDPTHGGFPDWFELFNPTAEPVNLSYWTLSDTATDPARFILPAGTVIGPGGYLLVWAPGVLLPSAANGDIHVDFSLAAGGESILLSAPDGSLVDRVDFGPQAADTSEGRVPDGGERIVRMNVPSPGAANVVEPPRPLLYYWNFNEDSPLLAPTRFYQLGAGIVPSLTGSAAVLDGNDQDFSSVNARGDDPAGRHLRVNHPLGATLDIPLPTTGFGRIVVRYETRRSGQGAGLQQVAYTLDGLTWHDFAEIVVRDTVPALVTLDFSDEAGVADNPQFGLRIRFAAGTGSMTGNNRFDNLTVEGELLDSDGIPRLLPMGDAAWDEDCNWSTALRPSGAGAVAVVGPPVVAGRSVTLGSPVRLGGLRIERGNSPGRNRLIGDELVFDGAGEVARLWVTGAGADGGYAEFDLVRVELASDLEIDATDAGGHAEFGGLRLRRAWAGAGGLTKRGKGMAVMTGEGKEFLGPLAIEQGVFGVSQPAAPEFTSGVSVASGGQLRLVSGSTDGEDRAYRFGGGAITLAGGGRAPGLADARGALRYQPDGASGGRASISNLLAFAAAATVHVEGRSNRLEFAGGANGAHLLTKTGEGTLAFTGSTIISAVPVAVEAGTLEVSGSHPAAIHLAAGTALTGSGLVAAIDGPGTVSPDTATLTATSSAARLAAILTTPGGASGNGALVLTTSGAVPHAIQLFLKPFVSPVPGDRFRGGLIVPPGVNLATALAATRIDLFLADAEGEMVHGDTHFRAVTPDDDLTWSIAGNALEVLRGGSPTTYDQWRNLHFADPAERANDAVSGPDADRLFRYAFDLGLGDPTSPALPRFDLAAGTFQFAFDPAKSDLIWLVRSSPDLEDWTEILFDSRSNTPPPVDAGGRVSIGVPSQRPRLFLRLELQLRL